MLIKTSSKISRGCQGGKEAHDQLGGFVFREGPDNPESPVKNQSLIKETAQKSISVGNKNHHISKYI